MRFHRSFKLQQLTKGLTYSANNSSPLSILYYKGRYSSSSIVVVRPSLNTSKFKLSVNLNQVGYYSGSGTVTLIAG